MDRSLAAIGRPSPDQLLTHGIALISGTTRSGRLGMGVVPSKRPVVNRASIQHRLQDIQLHPNPVGDGALGHQFEKSLIAISSGRDLVQFLVHDPCLPP